MKCHGTINRHGLHLIVFDEQYSDNFVMTTQSGAPPRHLRADGFANAWLVASKGAETFTIVYQPESRLRLMEFLSLAGYCLVAAAAMRRLRRLA